MKKIVLVGAGSVQFGYGTLGELFASEALRESEVVLLDINAEALQTVLATAQSFLAEHDLPTVIKATTDREEALPGADFVIISIEVGDRFELWDQDRTLAQQYGIQQVYGENGGPGGLFHSLRIIPPILEICRDVHRLCPEAYIFNYSNPMSRICTTVHRALPDLRFVGLCHEVSSLERYLPSLLDTPFDNLDLVAGGLNHYSCLLKAHYRETGEDAYPDILQKAPAFFEYLPGASDLLAHYRRTGRFVETEGVTELDRTVLQSSRRLVERGLFQFILENYQLLPITTDSHFGEYPAWAYDIVDHQGILDFYQYYRLCLSKAEPRIELGVRERVVPIMEALVTGQALNEAAVNLPNLGLIEGLPTELAVEVPALIDGNGVKGERLPDVPLPFLALLQNQVGVHMMTSEAVLSGSKHVAVQALLSDPVMTKARCARELVDVMIGLQPKYLGYLQ
jgi:alpha-galactosidase/6-phospho-beta-glucosidase family protein